MNKRTRREYEQRTVLQDAGWSLSKRDSVAFNSGSETLEHWTAKCLVAFALKKDGYRIASEVEGPDGQTVDIIAYGTEDEPVAVETETNISDAVIEQKIGQYAKGTPIRDVFPVDVDGMPVRVDDALEYVRGEL